MKEKNQVQTDDTNRDIIKYSSKLNQIVTSDFGADETNLFWGVINELYETNKTKAVFSYSRIAKLIYYNGRPSILFKKIKLMSEKLLTVHVYKQYVDDDGQETRFVTFPSFTKFEGDQINRTLTVNVSKDFLPYINKLKPPYTRFLFWQMATLRSKYAKNLFRLLKQFHTTGNLEINKGRLYASLGVPKSYYRNIQYAEDRVFKPAVAEINEKGYFKNLKYYKIKKNPAYRNSKVIKFKFTFDPQLGKSDLQEQKSQNPIVVASKVVASNSSQKDKIKNSTNKSSEPAPLQEGLLKKELLKW